MVIEAEEGAANWAAAQEGDIWAEEVGVVVVAEKAAASGECSANGLEAR